MKEIESPELQNLILTKEEITEYFTVRKRLFAIYISIWLIYSLGLIIAYAIDKKFAYYYIALLPLVLLFATIFFKVIPFFKIILIRAKIRYLHLPETEKKDTPKERRNTKEIKFFLAMLESLFFLITNIFSNKEGRINIFFSEESQLQRALQYEIKRIIKSSNKTKLNTLEDKTEEQRIDKIYNSIIK